MKLQIDTLNKSIKLEQDVTFSELIETMEKLFPKGEWKSYTLETNTVIMNWRDPIIINPHPVYPVYPTPSWPWWQNPITCDTGTGVEITSVYNVEISN